MESSVDDAAELFFLMEDKDVLGQPKTPVLAGEDDGRTISVHVLEFKTKLLEAVEELHIHRDAETRFEEQMCKLVLEKQELEWLKESLQSQLSRMSNENSESVAAVKKQFQAEIRKIEAEKGKNQLAAELKDKEIISLKEELKLLQLHRYSLEKKLSELEQKLQLQTQTKDSHLNQLGEVERQFATVSRQCATLKQAHEKLEQNVEEAMRMNKKLTFINEKQESTIKALKEDLERINKELITFKVTSACKPGEKQLQNVLKEQQFQQLQQKLFVEIELNKKLINETATERAERQEVLRSLQHSQCLLQTQTEALSRAEQDLKTLRQENQVLKTKHELNQERTRKKDDGFARLRDEHQNAKLAWEKKILQLQKSTEADREELMAVKEAYNQLQKEHKLLSYSAAHKAEDVQNSEITLKDQENPLSATSSGITLVKMSSLHEDLEESLTSHDNHEPTSRSDKDILDESTETQTARKDGCSQKNNEELDATMEVDVFSQSILTNGRDIILRTEDVNPTMNHMTKLCDVSEPVFNVNDKGCPSNSAHSDTVSSLDELSEPETRSVYGVDSNPLALEPQKQNLCTSEVTEPQTSDKQTDSHGYATSQSKDQQTPIPELLQSVSQKESQTTAERLSDDKIANTQKAIVFNDKNNITEGLIANQQSSCHETVNEEKLADDKTAKTQETIVLNDKMNITEGSIANRPSSCSETVIEEELSEDKTAKTQETIVFNDKMDIAEGSIANRPSSCHETVHMEPVDGEASLDESKNQFSTPELICSPVQNLPTDRSTETSLANVVSKLETKDLKTADATSENDLTLKETFLSQPMKAQLIDPVVSKEAKITNKDQDAPSTESTTANEQSDVDPKSTSVVDSSNYSGTRRCQASLVWDTFEKKMPHSAPSRPELWSSGFHEPVSPFCSPLFLKDKSTKRATLKTPDKLDTPSKRPQQKSSQGEWNAIKQSVTEMLPEKENQVLISYSSSPASSFVGNGLRQDCTPTVPPPKLQTRPVASTSDGKEERKHCDIMAQIAKLEEFMSSEGLTPIKRRKTD